MTSQRNTTGHVTVSLLEWQNVHSQDDSSKDLLGYAAETPDDLFYAIEIERTNFRVCSEDIDLGRHKKLEDAKAAAQKDYERRVFLSAGVEPIDSKGERNWFAKVLRR
ncbi:hypothetical protein A6U87_16555 [Rhizobium sp. AC44/96]|uniref:hypothetical protein n=1 Tax=Rhizobium sp. AC44/96 TaxID=1841654 RepID=UPI00080F99C6|nr:hypothetical protein [Rhizobium sp. AC44/96]OCJ04442.1 hypothetical protein A6U87_16555 [Rhizobium sp. AC44/96]